MLTNIVHERVSIHLDEGELKALLVYRDDAPARGRVVVCSPHPLLGGSMDNPASLALAEGCAEAGFAAVAWEYRPRTASLEANEPNGEFGTDVLDDAEFQRDVIDCGFIATWMDSLDLGGEASLEALCGYSYGSLVAGIASNGAKPNLLLSTPWAALGDGRMSMHPSSLLVSAEDEFEAAREMPGYTDSIERLTLMGTEHLFVNAAERLRRAACEWAGRMSAQSDSSACHASNLL